MFEVWLNIVFLIVFDSLALVRGADDLYCPSAYIAGRHVPSDLSIVFLQQGLLIFLLLSSLDLIAAGLDYDKIVAYIRCSKFHLFSFVVVGGVILQ
jgi:hypothetical protein